MKQNKNLGWIYFLIFWLITILGGVLVISSPFIALYFILDSFFGIFKKQPIKEKKESSNLADFVIKNLKHVKSTK